MTKETPILFKGIDAKTKQHLPSFIKWVKWVLIFIGAYIIVGNIHIKLDHTVEHNHTVKGPGYSNDIKIDLQNHHKNY